MRKWLYIVILAAFAGLAGCSSGEEKDILAVRLECAEACKQLKNPPFQQKTITDRDEIEIFAKAIHHAVKMGGDLDYGVLFFMHLSHSDGTERKYVLNISNDKSQTGLLVDTADSSQGYMIPEDHSNALRKIIYGM